MQRFTLKSALAITASAAMLAGAMATPSYAQNSDLSVAEDEIITIGTRRKDDRSAADVIAPVDVIPATELLNQAPNDIADALRISVPSFNVNTQPISDAATIIRPPNLRGLSPDNTPDSLEDIPLGGFTSVGAVAGAEFPSTAPFGFNGGQWYVRARYAF